MAIGRNQHEVGVHYKTTADTRGAREIAMAQQRALAQMRAQQSAFAHQNQRQWNRIETATRRSAFKTGSGATASLRNGINSGSKQVHQAGNNLVGVMEKHAVRMGGVFQQLGFQAQLAGTTLTRAFTLPAVAAVGLGTAVGVKLATRLESARAALGALLPVGYNVEALITRLRKKAIASPVFNTPELVDFTRKLVSAGVEVRKSERIIDSLGKVFQTFGVSGDGVSLALRGVTQAFSKGKLQAEELTGQIGEQIPALRLLSRAAGVSQAQFLKLVRQGKITSDVFADLLVKIGKFPEINKGATASLFTMQGAWDRLKESIFDALAMTWLKFSPQIQKSLKELERAIPGLLNAFGPLVPRMVDGFTLIVKAVSNTVRWYNNLDEGTKRLIKTLALVAVAGGPLILFFGKLATLAGAAVAAFRGLLTPLGRVAIGFAALASVGIIKWLSDVKEGTASLGGILDRLGAGWDSAGQKTVGFAGHLRTVNTDFDDGNKKAGKFSGSLRSLDKDFSDTASRATGLSGTFRSLGRDFTTLGETSKKPRDGIKEFGKEARQLWEAINGNLLPALGDLGRDLLNEVTPSIKDTGKAIKIDLLPALTEFTNKLSDWIKENSDTISKGVGGWAGDLIDGVREGIEKGDWKQVGKALGKAIGEAIKGIGDLTDKFKSLSEKVDWVEVGKEFGKHSVGFLVGFLSGLGEDVFTTDFWKKHWLDAIIAVLSVTGVGKIASVLGRIGAKIGGKVFKEIGKAFKKVDWGRLFQPLRNAFNNIFPPNTQAMFRGFFDNIANLVKTGAGKITSFANDVRTKFSAIFDDIGIRALYFIDHIKGIFRKIGDGAFKALDKALLQPVTKLGLRFRNAVVTAFARFVFLEVLVEAGKDLVQGFIDGVIELGKTIWETFKKRVLEPLIDDFKEFLGIKSPSTVFHKFGGEVIQGFVNGMVKKWNEIRGSLNSIWSGVKSDAAGAFGSIGSIVTRQMGRTRTAVSIAATAVRKTLQDSWNNSVSVTKSTWNTLVQAINNAWNLIRTRTNSSLSVVRSAIADAWNATLSNTRSSWDKILSVISSRWTAAKNTINRIWQGPGGIKSILNTFGNYVRRNVPSMVSAGVHAIGLAFNRVMRGAADPINWVITNVINNGIRNAFNTISRWLHLGLSLGRVPNIGVGGAGFSQRNRRERGGYVDTPLGMFQKPTVIVGEGNTNAPEYVIPTDPKYRPRAMKLYESLGAQLMATGGKVGHQAQPRRRKPGIPMMAAGGIIPGDGFGIGPNILGPIKSALQSFIMRPLSKTRGKPDAPIWRVAKGLPKSIVNMAWPIAAKALPKAGLETLLTTAKGLGLGKIVSLINSLMFPVGGFGLGSDNSNSVSAIVAMAKRFYSGARLSSGFRPGERTYHGRGLAADIIGGGASGMARIARGFYGISGRLLELIHSGGGGFFVKHGRRVGASYYRSVLGGHYSHVHVAARRDALAGGGGGGGTLGSWIRTAMSITRTAGSWFPALYALAMHESSGNPRAINLWDSNARAGHPSKGLFQTIDSTFNRYSLAGMKNIWNPVHNAVAAIRYIKSRYGSIFRIPSYRSGNRFVGGYRNGIPFVPEDGLKFLHKGERVVTAAANRKFGKAIARPHAMARMRSAEAGGGVHIHFDGPIMGRRDLEDAVTEIVDNLQRKGRMPGRRR